MLMPMPMPIFPLGSVSNATAVVAQISNKAKVTLKRHNSFQPYVHMLQIFWYQQRKNVRNIVKIASMS